MNLRGLGLQVDVTAQGARRERIGPQNESGGAVFALPQAGQPTARQERSERAADRGYRDEAPAERRPAPHADRAGRTPARERAAVRSQRREAEQADAPSHDDKTRSPAATHRRPTPADADREQATRDAVPAEPRSAVASASAVRETSRPEADGYTGRDVDARVDASTSIANSDSAAADSMLAQLGLSDRLAPGLSAAPPRAPLSALPVMMAAQSPALANAPNAMSPLTPAPIAAPAATLQAPQANAGMPALAATPATSPPLLDGFAALAALAGSGSIDATARESLDVRGMDIAPPKPDAAWSPLGATLPPSGVRIGDAAAAVASLGSIAMPAAPDAGFDDSFDQRIAWMADQRITHAEMRVSPEGAGPIDVRLQIEGHRVTAQFSAANADVRQALEAGMDRLRDLLGQRGMELADAQVGRQGAQRDPGGRQHGGHAGDADVVEGTTTTVGPLLRARGLIDEYA